MSRSKDDVRYWQEKGLFHETTKVGNVRKPSADLSVRIQHKGKREAFALKTPNKFQAATKARDIWRHLVMHGWQSTLAKFKPSETIVSEDSTIQTIGDFLQVLKTTDIPPKRLEGYSTALRTIVGSIAGIGKGNRGGNRQTSSEWRLKVNAVPIGTLSPASIATWKRQFLSRYDDDPVSMRRAKISVNSLLRRAKSLFAKKYLDQLGTTIVFSNPFSEIRFEKRQSQRYRSTFDIYALIAAAKDELKEQEPELFKIFLLASMAGLRRAEIDTLTWQQIRFDAGIISIHPTKWFHPKSEDSIGDVEVDPELLEVLAEMKNDMVSHFVIESSVLPQPDANFDHYRCATHFEKLIVWLRAHDVSGTKPLHELRKEFGSLVCDKHGVYVASQMLRHSSIEVTANHYLQKKGRKTIGLGEYL
jgi:integrase